LAKRAMHAGPPPEESERPPGSGHGGNRKFAK
jgi:hypothetical protein